MALYGDLSFSPDRDLLATAGHWPTVWDISRGRELYRLVQTRNPTFAAVEFSSDGELLATGSQDGIARVWRVSNGSQLFATPARENYIESIAFRPGGRFIAYEVRDGSIWLWDLATQAEQIIAAGSTANVVFSGDGEYLAFGAHGMIHVWNLRTSRERVALPFPIGQW